MKRSLADGIEQYVKALIARSSKHQIEIRRMEIAEAFNCVPSQVTYVLRTRFVPPKGYYTESRRGGQGYIRITEADRIPLYESSAISEFFEIDSSAAILLNEREKVMMKIIMFNVGQELPEEMKVLVHRNIITALDQFSRYLCLCKEKK